MRKIIVLEFLTLDGVMQAPGGPEEDTTGGFKYGGWVSPYFDDDTGKIMGEQMSHPVDLLLGRITYEIFAGYWPKHMDVWPALEGVTKYVVSRESIPLTWDGSVLIQDDAVEALKKLKSDDGRDIHVYGSGDLAQTLLKHDLVDELWLKFFPITLGSGKRLFAEGTIPAAFKLIDSKTSPSGVIVASYKRAGEVKTGTVGA